MKITHLIAIIVAIALLIGIIWFMKRTEGTPSVFVSEAELARFADATKVSYTSATGDIAVEYVGDLARVTGGDYDGVVLRQVVAASGAKYEANHGITLWTKGDEVRIETPQQVVYTGAAVVLPSETESPTPVEVEPIDTATTSSTTTAEANNLLGRTWIWERAVTSDSEIVPKKAEAFSVTFADGRVTGETDCNGFGGDYTIEGNTITMGEYMSTLMFCEDSEESTFTSLLTGSLTIETNTETQLVLKNRDGAMVYFTSR
jgi:heat shock protein HslJ/membrane-bound inhibitor of C-type lysozyme